MQCWRKSAKQFSALIMAPLIACLFFTLVIFAQSALTGTVIKNANLRAGPGTTFAIAGTAKQGQTVTIVGKNDAGDWYHLDSSQWIASMLVKITDTITATTTTSGATTKQPQSPDSATLIIQSIFFDGAVSRVESDEYAVIANTGTAIANLKGWRINAGDAGQDFTFPAFELKPGQACRVYTNEIHVDTCGFSFGSARAIWNNEGDCGYLYDTSGQLISTACYGSSGAASVATPQATPVQQANKASVIPTTIPTLAPTAIPQPTANPNSGQRYGAICKDGTQSGATGRGACSHHGGVDHWLVNP